ncbi:alpha-mannosidase 2-like [Convolutriloba macropyga]|uniref:alpha-mannosidase 2-like n=1 Tax=Convolutriloba macropyga TaxID=536237 RepID=UPI003F527DDC
MARFHFRRAQPCIIFVSAFIIVSWFLTTQIDEESAQKRKIQELNHRINTLQNQINRIEGKQTSGDEVVGRKAFSISYKLLDGSSRSQFDRPTIRAEHGTEDCLFAARHLKSSAELQTIELYNNVSFQNIDGGVWKQGYDIKYNDVTQFTADRPLEVVVVPHSHNDPGWIKTFEKYFREQTKNILNNVVTKLENHEKRRFIWAEISFFSLWWGEAPQEMRDRMLALIKKGQVEMVTAGWVMEDEANTHIYAMVDQMIEGNHWIKDNLGITIKTAWSIDPFGQSPTVAYLRKRMGFSNMLIQRTHYEVKKALSMDKKLEFIWRQQWDENGRTDMFCHMMPFYSYDVPHTCGPDPKICCQFDFARLPPTKYSCPWRVPPTVITDDNVGKKAAVLVDQYKKKATLFKSNVVLIPLGDDFRYDVSAECDKQFNNYEKLFDYINSHREMNTNIRWGTLSDYFAKVHERTQLSDFSKLSGDFFTYADREQHYWSGYFTSRPFYKKLDRIVESRLRSAEVAYSMANFLIHSPDAAKQSQWTTVASGLFEKLTQARRNMGLFLHHDGITGTAKDHVVVDYGEKLLKAIQNANDVIATSSEYLLLSAESSKSETNFPLNSLVLDEVRKSHDSLPESFVVPVREMAIGAKYPLVFYNSLGIQRQQMVMVLVDGPDVKVLCHAGSQIDSQVAPKWARIGTETAPAFQPNVYELWFRINIHPLSLSRYFIQSVSPNSVDSSQPKVASKSTVFTMRTQKNVDHMFENHAFKIEPVDPTEFEISNYQMVLHFADNGLLRGITDRNTNKRSDVSLDFVTYGTSSAKDKSGAYLFLPDGPAKSVPSLSPVVAVEKGAVMSRVIVQLPNLIHTVQLFNSPGIDGHAVSISNLVDIRILSNRELAMRVDATSLMNDKDGAIKKRFYTDLNGFQMQARHFYSKLPIQANFYPMPTQMVVDNPEGKSRLSLHSAQALGAGVTSTGHIDVILDRRLMQDDNRGLFQGVKDNKLTPNEFWLVLENFTPSDVPNPSTRDASDYTLYPTVLSNHASLTLNSPLLTLIPKQQVKEGIEERKLASLVGYKSQSDKYLPCDVNVLSFRTMKLQPEKGLLILHRQCHSCRPTSFGDLAPTNCSLTNGQVDLTKLFTSSSSSLKFTEFTLNGITPLNSELSQTSVQIEPCEINTYQVEID